MPPVDAWAVRRLPALALIVVAAVLWWCVGCLPWVASGLSQATTTGGVRGSASEGLAGVRLAVPLIAHQLPLLVVLTTIGGALAGAVTALGRGRASANAACAVLGAGLAVAVALVQSRSAIEENAAGNFAADSRVLAGLCLAAVAGTTFPNRRAACPKWSPSTMATKNLASFNMSMTAHVSLRRYRIRQPPLSCGSLGA